MKSINENIHSYYFCLVTHYQMGTVTLIRANRVTYREICERAVAAIQESSYMNLTYKGVMQDKDAQLGCIVDEEAKVVWLNEPVVTGEARSQDKGESKFSPLCEKRKNILTLIYNDGLNSIISIF